MNDYPRRILFLAPYPFDSAPSQRFRFEQYLPYLKEKNISWDFISFYSPRFWQGMIDNRNPLWKAFNYLLAFFRISYRIFNCGKYEIIFLHREITPAGPPVPEWFITRVRKKKVVYDFDDAIWLTDDITRHILLDKLKWKSKVARICRWSYRVSCGNEYLRRFALSWNPDSYLNPTTIDMNRLNNQVHVHRAEKTVVGWSGSHTTLKYLYMISAILKSVIEDPGISLTVICNKKPEWEIEDYTFIEWDKARETEDLLTIDIGVMPLPDDPWTRGKCGFKALQYFSVGIPALVSPLPVNRVIVDHGVNGYYCDNGSGWKNYMYELAGDPEKRTRFGRNGRKKVIDQFSTESNLSNFLGLLT